MRSIENKPKMSELRQLSRLFVAMHSISSAWKAEDEGPDQRLSRQALRQVEDLP